MKWHGRRQSENIEIEPQGPNVAAWKAQQGPRGWTPKKIKKLPDPDTTGQPLMFQEMLAGMNKLRGEPLNRGESDSYDKESNDSFAKRRFTKPSQKLGV